MKQYAVVWAVAALALLAGCEKPQMSGETIRFRAVSQSSIISKVQYSGDREGTRERIDWKQGDAIRIYSIGATCGNDPSYGWADYGVVSDGVADGATSKATISVTSPQGGLSWGDDVNTFYAIYPSPGTADSPATVMGNAASPFNGTIAAAQEGTKVSVEDFQDPSRKIDVYYPSAAMAYQTAYVSLAEPAGTANLDFYPAYTAFHISAGWKDKDITVNSVRLVASSLNALTGAFNIYNGGSGWTYVTPPFNGSGTGANNAITYTFNGDKPVLTSSNPRLEFVMYAVPQDLTNLTIEFNVDVQGEGTGLTRRLALKTAEAVSVNGRDYAAGDYLTFTKCRKAYIHGLLIPGSVWKVNETTPIKMRMSVGDWDDETVDPIDYNSSSTIFNATGLNQTGTGGRNFDFSLFSPAGKTWKATARNASDGSVATDVVLNLEGGGSSTGGVLSGTVGNPAWLHFEAASGTPGKQYYVTFSVDVDGTEYSIDSEVARGGWGPGKSYSYFTF